MAMNDYSSTNRSTARWALALLTATTTGLAGWVYWSVLRLHTVGPILSGVLIVLFVLLFASIAFSFWIATAGLIRRLRKHPEESCGSASPAPRDAPLEARTAILMPVYNESPQRVFAGLRAIHESLQMTGQGGAFDFFVLSDSTDPDVWMAEELAWARMVRAAGGESRVYYRHRTKNVGRKSGNIADFCRRWGAGYQYMIVLDADSVMSGETIVELARRMEADSQIGILQTPPVPVNRGSLFARCQQFASAVYGPVFLEGFAWWAGSEGNYWGHNAIIRVGAFIQACGLPKLSGDGPLGGEILSHDFVEAALIRRAGFKVCMAGDLEGSYEECPPTLVDFAQRDQRWCQGNLQHLRLIASAGIHPISRLHLGLGAMSYLSSPLWLLSLVLTALAVAPWRSSAGLAADPLQRSDAAGWAIGLFATTMALLLLPKLWGYLLLLTDPRRLAQCGGPLKAAAGALVETVVSMLVAPILMAFHSTFVVATLLGRRVEWNAQQRGEHGQAMGPAIAAHWKQSALGLAAALTTWTLDTATLVWLLPVLLGLILAIPLSLLLGSVRLGQALGRAGLLLIPQETAAPAVLTRHRHFLRLAAVRELTEGRGLFRRMLVDPALVALHRSIVEATETGVVANAGVVAAAQRQLLAGGPLRVSAKHRQAILSDPAALETLHRFVWTTTGGAAKAADMIVERSVADAT
jgi:membrane glycosyltransferase